MGAEVVNIIDLKIKKVKEKIDEHNRRRRNLGSPKGFEQWELDYAALQVELRTLLDVWYSVQFTVKRGIPTRRESTPQP